MRNLSIQRFGDLPGAQTTISIVFHFTHICQGKNNG
jgi:hypothetical protein